MEKFHAVRMRRVSTRILFFRPASLLVVGALLLLTSCIYIPQVNNTASRQKPASLKLSPYQYISLEEMVRRYIAKTEHEPGSIEGIYTVSAEVNRKGKGFLFGPSRERIVDKRNNYATVAILRNWPGATTEYVEISLTNNNATAYPIISEISSLADEQGFIFNHLEHKGKRMPFTFRLDETGDLLEGVYTEVKRGTTITYKLSYLRTYPKNKPSAGR